MEQKNIFFIYLDKTNKNRVFYVGKGKIKRTKNITKRNKLWHRIAAKYGHKREIIFATKDESFAFLLEIKLIKEYKTFAKSCNNGSGWGANLTEGGQGVSGRVVSIETKEKLRKAHTGKVMSEESKIKTGLASSQRKHSPETKIKIGILSQGEKSGQSKLNNEKVIEIRLLFITNNFTINQLSIKYNISAVSILNIIKYKTWKHLELKVLDIKSYLEIVNKILLNMKHKKSSLLNENDIINIRNEYKNNISSKKDLSKKYKIHIASVNNIINNRTWKHIPINDINLSRKYENNKGENNYNSILSDIKVLEIRKKFSLGQYSQKELSNIFKISQSLIRSVLNYDTWKHIPSFMDEIKKNIPNFGKISKSGLTDLQVKEIRYLFSTKQNNITELSKKYGICNSSISKIVKGITWKHILPTNGEG